MDKVLVAFVFTLFVAALTRYLTLKMLKRVSILRDLAGAALLLIVICSYRPIELNSLVVPTGWLIGCMLTRLYNRMA